MERDFYSDCNNNAAKSEDPDQLRHNAIKSGLLVRRRLTTADRDAYSDSRAGNFDTTRPDLD